MLEMIGNSSDTPIASLLSIKEWIWFGELQNLLRLPPNERK